MSIDTLPASASNEGLAVDATSTPSLGFHRALDRADRITGISFMLVVGLNFASAASRYAAGRPIIGADEVQVFAMVWLIFLGAVMAAVRRAHLRMDVLTMGLAPRSAWIRTLAEMLLTLVTCVTMVVVSSQFAWQIHEFDQRSDAAEIPMWIPHISVAIGFLGVAVVSLLELNQLLRRRPN
jgi:TRAP-type transport system small permease protein